MKFLGGLFRAPTYRRYVILGNSQKGSFWDCSYWSEHIFPPLNTLIDSELGVSVHCRQVVGPNSREVKFGRLEWSQQGASAWCHGVAGNEDVRSGWSFVDLQVFSPPRTTLIDRGGLPSVYIQVKPVTRRDVPRKTAYDQGIQLAIVEDFARQRQHTIDAAIADLTASPGVVALYYGESKVGALNEFESILREDFMYRGMLDTELPDVRRMRGKWAEKEFQRAGI